MRRSATSRLARLSLSAAAWAMFMAYAAPLAGAASPPPIAAATAFGPGGGSLIQSPLVVARDQGASAPLDGVVPGVRGESAWMFGDTFLGSGSPGFDCDQLSVDSEAFSGRADAAGITVASDYSDASGTPTEFLPFTSAEALYNGAHHTLERAPCSIEPPPPMCLDTVYGSCDAEYVLNAGAMIDDPTRRRMLLFFDVSWRLRTPPEGLSPAEDADTVGAGVASWSGIRGVGARRLYFNRTSGSRQRSPYVFGDGRPPSNDPDPQGAVNYTGREYGQAPIIPPHQSRYLYLYDVTPPSARPDCGLVYCYATTLARVPLATLTDETTWRFFDANDRFAPWQQSMARATYLRSTGPGGVTRAGPPNFSVTYDPYLRRYVMIYQRVLTTTIGYRTAPDPWGPWSAEGVVPFSEVSPGVGGLTYAAQAHDEFSQERGKVLYLTYVAGNTPGGVYVVRITFR